MGKAAWLLSNYAAATTPTGSATAAGLGWDKLVDPQPRHRARVDATSAFFIQDLGSAKNIDVAAIISSSIDFADTVRVRGSVTDPTATGSLTLDTGILTNVTTSLWRGNVVLPFATASVRYLRWDLTGANPIYVGLAPCGLLYRPGRNFQYGAQEGVIDLGKRDRNEDTGGEFTVAGPRIRQKLIAYNGLTKSETRDGFNVQDILRGVTVDVLFVEDPDATAYDRARDAIWGSYRGVGADSYASRVASQVWARPFRLTERL